VSTLVDCTIGSPTRSLTMIRMDVSFVDFDIAAVHWGRLFTRGRIPPAHYGGFFIEGAIVS